MTNIINLTPHELIIYKDNEVIEKISSSGIVRVKEENEAIGKINGIPLYKKKYIKSEGLPEPQKDTLYFVSLIVSQVNPKRQDLILSSDLIRDKNGRILGCSSFAKL